MDKKSFLFVAAFLLMSAGFAVAEEKQASAPPAMDAAQKEEMEKMKKLGAPGVNHKVLDFFAGKWKHTIKAWMAPEGAEPVESRGTNEAAWILNGRFLQSTIKGDWQGEPFEGMNLLGYDNIRGEYKSVWLDNMSTGMATSTAQYDAAAKTFTETGSMSCPMTGEKDKAFRATWKIVDDGHYTYEMHTKDKAGKEFKSMEIAYERVA